jgi:hypothetical protein
MDKEMQNIRKRGTGRFLDFYVTSADGFYFNYNFLGDDLFSFDLFLDDFESFVSENMEEIRKSPNGNRINLVGNCLTLWRCAPANTLTKVDFPAPLSPRSLTKLHWKKLLSRPKLKFFKYFNLSHNCWTYEEVCQTYSEVNDVERKFIYVTLKQGLISSVILNSFEGDTIVLNSVRYDVDFIKSYKSVTSETVMNLRRQRYVKKLVTYFLHGIDTTDTFVRNFTSYNFERILFRRFNQRMWSGQHDMEKLLSVYDCKNNRYLRSLSFLHCSFSDLLNFHLLWEFLKEKPTLTSIRFKRCKVSFDIGSRECNMNDVWEFVELLLRNTSLLKIELDFDNGYNNKKGFTFIEDETLALLHERTERNKKLRQTLITVCCLLIFHHRRIKPLHGDSTLRCCLPKDVMKIVAKMIFQDRFNIYPILDQKF